MAYIAGSLADGFVAIATGTIYTSAAKTIIRNLIFCNINAAPQTINLFITRSGGTRRQIYRFILAQWESVTTLSGGGVLLLANGDIIEADTTTASAVSYVVGGATSA